MKWFRVIVAVLRELARAPEGATVEELGHYAQRRLMLRGLLTVMLLPIVMLGVFGWPWAKQVRHRAVQPCSEALDAAAVSSWSGGSATAAPPKVGMYGCEVVWRDGSGGALLAVRVRAPGGLIIDGLGTVLREAPSQPSTSKPWLERWSWDRPETAKVVHRPNAGDAVIVDLGDGSLVLEDLTTSQRDLGRLVINALSHDAELRDYLVWLD